MSCFLLFVTLISTFQNAELGRKTQLWARVVDIILGPTSFALLAPVVGTNYQAIPHFTLLLAQVVCY